MSDFGQRHSTYSKTDQRMVRYSGHRTEHQHSVPPPNRQTIRKSEPMGRTIPPDVHQPPTEQLGRPTTTSSVHAQLMAKCYHKEDTLRTHSRVYPKDAPTTAYRQHARNKRKVGTDLRSQKGGPGGNHTCPITVQRLPSFPTVLRRRQGVARCQELENDAPHFQTSPKKIWPFPHHKKNLSDYLRPETPPSVAHSPGVSCFTPNAIQRNTHTWNELPRTSS